MGQSELNRDRSSDPWRTPLRLRGRTSRPSGTLRAVPTLASARPAGGSGSSAPSALRVRGALEQFRLLNALIARFRNTPLSPGFSGPFNRVGVFLAFEC